MAKDQSEKPEVPRSQNPLESLDGFLSRFVDLTSQLTTGMLAQSTDADDKELISSYAEPLREQVSQLSDYIRQAARGTSKQVIEEIGTVLRLTAADALTESGMRIAQNLSSQKAKIGISDIIALIKKIIRALFDILNIRKPRWLEPLLDLIDEIVNFLVSIGVLKLAHTLSKRHQDYMAELTQMKRLQRATTPGIQDEEEEDEE
jgi:alkylhydroperoxidase/carboxymuconolactone decarboxylase family protein YurZ